MSGVATVRRLLAPAVEPLTWSVSSALLAGGLLVERGWVQADFLLVRTRTGPRPVGPYDLGWIRPESVVAGCLMGAIAYGSWLRTGGPDRLTSRAAADQVWRTWAAEQGRIVPTYLDHGPDARAVRLRDLARWNDARGRTAADVSALLAAAA